MEHVNTCRGIKVSNLSMLHILLLSCLYLFGYGFEYCPDSCNSRCMIEGRVNCSMTNNDNVYTDSLCCDGLTCVPLYIPPTDTQIAYSTTQCVQLPPNIQNNNNDNKIKITKIKAKIPPLPPIFPNEWAAPNFTSFNYSDNTTGNGSFYYNVNNGAIRTDFNPICPFLQLWDRLIKIYYVCIII